VEIPNKLRRISRKFDQSYHQEEIFIKFVTPVQSCRPSPFQKKSINKGLDRGKKRTPFLGNKHPLLRKPLLGDRRKNNSFGEKDI